MTAPDFTHKPVLRGGLVTLRPITPGDAARMRELMADPQVTHLTGSAHSTAELEAEVPWSIEELVSIYERWSEASDRIVWAIVERSTDQVVGEAVLNELDAENRSCGFRIWVSGAQDRGLGTEAVRLAVRHAFEEAGLHRVELEVYDFNPRARHVYEKIGFVHEGTRRDALLFDGQWVDAHGMAMLESEWAERSAGST